jgi:hypothetical protein
MHARLRAPHRHSLKRTCRASYRRRSRRRRSRWAASGTPAAGRADHARGWTTATDIATATTRLQTCVAAGCAAVQDLPPAVNLPPAGVLPAQTVAATRVAALRGPQVAAAFAHVSSGTKGQHSNPGVGAHRPSWAHTGALRERGRLPEVCRDGACALVAVRCLRGRRAGSATVQILHGDRE